MSEVWNKVALLPDSLNLFGDELLGPGDLTRLHAGQGGERGNPLKLTDTDRDVPCFRPGRRLTCPGINCRSSFATTPKNAPSSPDLRGWGQPQVARCVGSARCEMLAFCFGSWNRYIQ